jgi:hypothetical protein
MESLPGPQRLAVRHAVLRLEPSPDPVDPQTTAMGVRALLRQLAANRPVLHDDFFGEAQTQIQASPPSVFTVVSETSLAQLAQNTLHNAVSTILRLTAEHSHGAVFTQNMADYLNGVFAADKEKVPRNVAVYHSDGNDIKSFVSAGTQTLQGLALAFKCQPSAIVRLTAEQSPGAGFSAEMADYLDDVFGRSTTPVPDGIHLYYQK